MEASHGVGLPRHLSGEGRRSQPAVVVPESAVPSSPHPRKDWLHSYSSKEGLSPRVLPRKDAHGISAIGLDVASSSHSPHSKVGSRAPDSGRIRRTSSPKKVWSRSIILIVVALWGFCGFWAFHHYRGQGTDLKDWGQAAPAWGDGSLFGLNTGKLDGGVKVPQKKSKQVAGAQVTGVGVGGEDDDEDDDGEEVGGSKSGTDDEEEDEDEEGEDGDLDTDAETDDDFFDETMPDPSKDKTPQHFFYNETLVPLLPEPGWWRRRPQAEYQPCLQQAPTYVRPPDRFHHTGYLVVYAHGGLNQQRIAVCDAVAIARLLNATLLLPILIVDKVWQDQSSFADLWDADHFIDTLANDVRIVRTLPRQLQWRLENVKLAKKSTIEEPPHLARPEWFVEQVLPVLKETGMACIHTLVKRFAHDNIPRAIERLRCKANFEALRFVSPIEDLGSLLVDRMRARFGGAFMAIHMRYERSIVAMACCPYHMGEAESEAVQRLRDASFKGACEVPNMVLEGRRALPLREQRALLGGCPITPAEVAVMLRALDFDEKTPIYIAGGRTWSGDGGLGPLKRFFPEIQRKNTLASEEELAQFVGHPMQLAALDYIVCTRANIFVKTEGGNMANIIMGERRYRGHLHTIEPNLNKLLGLLTNSSLGWSDFSEGVWAIHVEKWLGRPISKTKGYPVYRNPLDGCMCKGGPGTGTLQQTQERAEEGSVSSRVETTKLAVQEADEEADEDEEEDEDEETGNGSKKKQAVESARAGKEMQTEQGQMSNTRKTQR